MEKRKMKSRLLIIIGIVLIGVFGFGMFFTLNSVSVLESLPDSSTSSEIPLYDGHSYPSNIPVYDNNAAIVEIDPND